MNSFGVIKMYGLRIFSLNGLTKISNILDLVFGKFLKIIKY